MKYYKTYTAILAGITSVFMLCFPFIMRLHVREPKGMELTYFAKKSRIMLEVFLYQKEMALFLFALFLTVALILGVVIYWVILEKPPMGWKKDRNLFLALGVYFLLNVISVLFSEYRELGLFGSGLDYEGLAAIFAYILLFMVGYAWYDGKRATDILGIALRVLMLVLIAGTFLELVCGPVMNIGWIQNIIVPEKYEHLLETWVLRGYDDISLTFSNPGFFGGFCGMLLPIGLGMAFTDKRKAVVAMDLLLVGGMLFCVIMSDSTGALYGTVGAVFLEILVLCWKQKGLGKWKKNVIKLGGCFICTGILLIAAQTIESVKPGSVGQGAERIQEEGGRQISERSQSKEGSSFLEDIFGKVKSSVINEQYEKRDDIFEVTKMQLEDGVLSIQGKEALFTVEALEDDSEMTVDKFRFTDGNGKQLEVEKETNGKTRLSGSAYESVYISVKDRILNLDLGYRDPVGFYAKNNKLYYIDFNGSLLSAIPQPVLPQLKMFYPLFTGRGYFWISSLPILKETLILGKGIGAFPFVYEQSEVVGMLNVHGSADYCVEQAHSWYLQTAVSSGIVSLLCMLFVFVMALKNGIKEQIYMKHGVLQWTDFLMWGLLAYMVTGIVNNSCVATAPMFWLLLGVHCRRVRE